MAKSKSAKPTKLTVETFKHEEATRTNIPTAEYQSVMREDEKQPIPVTYRRGRSEGEAAGDDALAGEKARRNRDLDPQLVWRGKDQQDWSDLVVQAPPLYIQEKVNPKVIIDDLRAVAGGRRSVAGSEGETGDRSPSAGHQLDLFADFNGLPEEADRTDFYRHEGHWSNRLILGDSLQVMASLAEREGLRGKVQCIYLDPPYGIKFNSNFQWSTTSRDVKDGNPDHITREPEQVKAFRDTWRDGIHSYLTYLRDRLTVARDLLTESGSIFVQIGDENVHRVRALMDEVFGDSNFVSLIQFSKTSSASSELMPGVADYVLWYARQIDRMKYRPVFRLKRPGEEGASKYDAVEDARGVRRLMTTAERQNPELVPPDSRVYTIDQLTSQRPPGSDPFAFQGQTFVPVTGYWKTSVAGLKRLAAANRVVKAGNRVRYVRYLDDFSVFTLTNMWTDTGSVQSRSDPKIYVVQSATGVIQRCILMSTDPGDLVLDPTCGSGTTAYVAEQWGRRWITIDTSRVALALARARIMGARYPYYLLADSRAGQLKEAELRGGRWPAAGGQQEPGRPLTTDHKSLKHGFVYERVPHITLKSIANNAEIDVIWEDYERRLTPLREQISRLLADHRSPITDHRLEEWEIPREAPPDWPPATEPLITAFWRERIERQKAIDASIAAKADFEYLYDKPYEDKKTVRVAGPFTVESLSPHRVLGLDEDDELIDPVAESQDGYGEERDFVSMILENLKTAGVQQAHKEDRIDFTALTPWPGDFICAEGRFSGDQWPVIGDRQGPSPTTDHQQPTTGPGDQWPVVGGRQDPSPATGHQPPTTRPGDQWPVGGGRQDPSPATGHQPPTTRPGDQWPVIGGRQDPSPATGHQPPNTGPGDQWPVIGGRQDPSPTTDHQQPTTEKRAAIFIGPEFGTVSRLDLVEAAREAGDAGFDLLIACAFNYDAHSSEFAKLGRIPVLKARMNADLHMAEDLKNTGKGNLFVVFGEPDISVVSGRWLVTRGGRMVVDYERVAELSGLGSLEAINGAGRDGLSALLELSTGGTIRSDQPGPAGGDLGAGQHRGGGGALGDGGIPPVPGLRERLPSRDGDVSAAGESSGAGPKGASHGRTGADGLRWTPAQRTQALAAIKELRDSDFPLSLTTDHWTQITVLGVDVFHPSTGEVRSDGAEGIACWMIDTDYNQEAFFVRHAYFLGANDPYKALKTTLKAEIDPEAWASLNSDTSRPFPRPLSGRIAVKVINHLGDEVMKVFRV
ncbi:adenine specific DNA methylase Mod [Thioflavicoccus mobilis 8321]|uniref:site-specific DNA-methyltransferase (adenine-specific) n=1 Tax=Thioflavicoccus mobilis 8321 TaxID=765912 RepID=L0H1I7_9GAMM|nr:DNA methyltransferase [Thioflavicoccus mobilis]AGA92081.1 adenine specific DNA methylase Mod [Thioflavicoccus mobilis 8321]